MLCLKLVQNHITLPVSAALLTNVAVRDAFIEDALPYVSGDDGSLADWSSVGIVNTCCFLDNRVLVAVEMHVGHYFLPQVFPLPKMKNVLCSAFLPLPDVSPMKVSMMGW